MVFQTVGSKAVGFISQIFLARLLEPKDFGLVAIAYMVLAIPSMLRQSGLPTILVQKGPRLARWANAAFWLDAAFGAATMLAMLIAAPLAAVFYHSRTLGGVILVVACSGALNSMMTVPTAILTRDLRFRDLAAIGFGYNVLAAALSVLFAFLGFGAYSFVIPLPVCLGLRCVVLFWLTRPRISLDPQFHRWRALMPDTGRILLAGVSSTAVGQLDLLALSVTAAKPTVGQYFLANNLSSQVLALLAINLGSVLFPVLAKMSGDPPRQTGAYLRACRALALIGVPLCLGEALLAKPAVRVIFGAKWNDAAALLILLACAAAIKLAGSSAGSLLLAQGRYHANMVWSVINAAVFGTAVFAGACWLSAVGVAAGALAAAILIGPPMVWWAVRPGGGRWRDVASVYVPPVVMSAVSLLPGLSVMLLLKHTVADDVVVMITALVTAPPIYLIIACKFMPAEVAEIAAHLPPLMRVLVGLRLLPTRPVSR